MLQSFSFSLALSLKTLRRISKRHYGTRQRGTAAISILFSTIPYITPIYYSILRVMQDFADQPWDFE